MEYEKKKFWDGLSTGIKLLQYMCVVVSRYVSISILHHCGVIVLGCGLAAGILQPAPPSTLWL